LAAKKEYLPIFALARELNIDVRNPAIGRRWNWLTRLDVSQPIFRGGAVRAAAKQAELAYDIAELDQETTQLFVCYTAEVAYWSLSRAEGYLDAMEDYVNIVTSLQSVVAERYGEGYISKSDLLQVESRLSDAEYQLSEAQQRRDIALHNFNMLIGVEPTTPVMLAESIFADAAMPMRESMSDILACHPDYKSSQLEIDNALWAERAARARFLPQIEVGLYGLLQPTSPHVKGGDLRLDGGLLFSFSTPLYHFGERKHVVSAARSSYLRKVNATAEVADRITQDESDTWTNLCATRDRVQAIEKNLSIASENLAISTYSYREGLATVLDVLQAQLSWLQIYTNAIAARYDYAIAIAAYKYVVCK
jgi:outer membrane protein TolC